jgi:nucleotide-binding universal stress UspA family protein
VPEELERMKKLEMKLVVVGIDGSPAAAEALEWAVAVARLTGARVEAVYAWDPSAIVAAGPPQADWRPLRQAAKRHAVELVRRVIGAAEGVEVAPRMIVGRAAEALVDASADADLLVVGTRGVAGLESIEVGSVSHHCVAYAECPVVIVRHDPLRKPHDSGEDARHASSVS